MIRSTSSVPRARTAARVASRLAALLVLLPALAACGEGDAAGEPAGTGASAPGGEPPATWAAALETAAAGLDNPAEPVQSDLATLSREPRAHRLLEPGTPVTFTAAGEPPPPIEPFHVPLSAGFGVEQREGRYRIEPGEVLFSAEGLGISSDDVAEALLRVRVGAGTTLRLQFHMKKSKEVARVALPVSPSGEWQTLRIVDPLLMRQHTTDQVERMSLMGDTAKAETLLIELDPVTIVRPGAVHALSASGRADMVVEGDLRPAFWQSTPGRLRAPLPAGAGRLLRGAAALLLPGVNEIPDAARAELELLAEGADGALHPLQKVPLRAGEPWTEWRVELPDGLDAAALVMRVPTLLSGAVVAHSGWRALDSSRPPQRLVLLVMDTLRADALACYGHPSNRTDALDRLAAEGVRFARCYAQAHWTRPSMPSIMTGLYTPDTGVENKFDQLPEAYDTLAERFGRAGFRTAAFIANAQAGPGTGLGQGWDELRLFFGQDSDAQLREIVEPGLPALADDDLLLYVHLMEAHGPYGPERHEPLRGPQPGEPVEFDDKYDRYWVQQPTDRTRREGYDFDVQSMDVAIGGFLERVVDRWEAEGGPVVVAALSDHGEYLGEDGVWGHGKGLLRTEVVHTPLIVRAPGRIEPGRVWPLPVENLDVGVTLLELAGVDLEAAGVDRGRSLLRVLEEGRGAHVALSNNVSGKMRQLTLWGPDGALLGENDEIVATYDAEHRFRADPGEAVDHTAAFVELWRRLHEQGAPVRDIYWSQASESVSSLDAASLEQLEALGYLGY